MSIRRVWIIEEDCTACGACADEAPEVFEVDDVAKVKKGVNAASHETEIISAAELCPVECIKYE